MFIKKCVFVIVSLFFVANFPLTAGKLGEKDDTSQESEKVLLRTEILNFVKSKTENGKPIYIKKYYGYVFVPYCFPPTYNKISERPFHLAEGQEDVLVDLLVSLVPTLYGPITEITPQQIKPLIKTIGSLSETLEEIRGKGTGEHGTVTLLKKPHCPYERNNLLTSVLQKRQKK